MTTPEQRDARWRAARDPDTDEGGDLAALIDAGRCRECGTVQDVEPHDEGGIVLVIHTEYQDGLPVGTCGGSLDSAATFTPLYRAPAPSVVTPPPREGEAPFTWRVEVSGMAGQHPEITAEVGIPEGLGYRWEPLGDFLTNLTNLTNPQAEAGTGDESGDATCRHSGVSLPPSSYLEQER